MNLTMADVGNTITALDDAIEYVKTKIDSELPPRSSLDSYEDEVNRRSWNEDLKIYRKLRNMYAKVEEESTPCGTKVSEKR